MAIRSLQYVGSISCALLMAACTRPNKWPFDSLLEAGVSPDRSGHGRDGSVAGTGGSALPGDTGVEPNVPPGLPLDGGGGATGAIRDARAADFSSPDATVVLAVEVVPPGSGSVRVEPLGSTCTASCSYTFGRGALAAITAAPALMSVFRGWSKDCAGSNACELDMSGDRSVSATFVARGSMVWNLPLENAEVRTLALSADAVVAAGHFSDMLFLGGQGLRSAGEWDAFLAEVGPDGSPRWAKRFGGPKNDYFGIAALLAGELLLGGVFIDSVDFGGGPLSVQSGALTKFSRTGDYRWAVALLPPVFVLPMASGYLVGTSTYTFYGYTERFSTAGQKLGTPLGTPQALTSGAAHPAGGYVVGGWIQNEQNILGRPYVPEESDPFVGRFTSTGASVWAAAFSGPDHESINSVDVDALGDVYAVGRFDGALTIDGERHESMGKSGIFLLKLDGADGHVQWKKVVVDTEYQEGYVLVDGDGVVWSGTSRSPPVLGGPALPPGPFVARFTSAGAHQWSAALDSEPRSLATGHGALYVGQRGGLSRLVP